MSSSPSKMPPNDLARVLVLDDDEQYRESLRRRLAGLGLVVDVASTTSEAEKYLAYRSYQMVITDIVHFGEKKAGDEFIIEMEPFMQGAKIVVITGSSIESIKHLEELRALDVTIIQKGDELGGLNEIVAETLRANRLAVSDTAADFSDSVSTQLSIGPSVADQPGSPGDRYNIEAVRSYVNEVYSIPRQLAADGDLSLAEALYRKLVEVLPRERASYIELLEVLRRQGKTAEAKQIEAEIDERFPVGNAGTATLATGPADLPPAQEGTNEGAPSVNLAEANRAIAELKEILDRPASASAPTAVGTNTEVPVADQAPVAGNRFSPESERVIGLAEALRRSLNQKTIFRSILFFALLGEAPTGLAELFLSSLGISREAMLELIERKLHRGARRTPTAFSVRNEVVNVLIEARSRAFPFSDNVLSALSAAETVAAEHSSSVVQPDHIFIALMRSTDQAPGWIGWMLGNEKAEWIRKTLADWSADIPVTEESLRDEAIAAGLYSPASASSDAAAKDDLLNFKQSASAMVNIVIKQDTVPPLVVGVYGPWGSGKSTYLELVKKGLLAEYDRIRKASDGSKAINLLVVEYDAWAYSDAPKLWAGLITKIAKKLDEDLGWWGRIKYLFKTHRARLVGGILLGLIPFILAVPAVLLGLLKPLSAGLVSAAAGPLISVVSAWLNQRQAVYGNVRALASKFDSAPASGVINSIQDEFRDALESWIKQKTGADAADATTSTTTTSRSSYSSMSLTAVRSRGSSTYWRRSSSREGNLHCVYGCGHACRL